MALIRDIEVSHEFFPANGLVTLRNYSAQRWGVPVLHNRHAVTLQPWLTSAHRVSRC